MANLLEQIPDRLTDELLQTLLRRDKLKIERIVSRGHITPEDQWYNQEWDEWILVVEGAAQLIYEDGNIIDLKPGDYLLIPAHCRHRVTWTAPDDNTIWLAVHLAPEPEQ